MAYPKVDQPRDLVSPSKRGYKQVYVSETVKKDLDAAAKAEGCATLQDYIVKCHKAYQELKNS